MVKSIVTQLLQYVCVFNWNTNVVYGVLLVNFIMIKAIIFAYKQVVECLPNDEK